MTNKLISTRFSESENTVFIYLKRKTYKFFKMFDAEITEVEADESENHKL